MRKGEERSAGLSTLHIALQKVDRKAHSFDSRFPRLLELFEREVTHRGEPGLARSESNQSLEMNTKIKIKACSGTFGLKLLKDGERMSPARRDLR